MSFFGAPALFVAPNPPPPRREITAVVLGGSGMEDFYSVYLARFFESRNFLTNVVRSRISARGHDDANGSIVRPTKITIAHSSFDRGFQRLCQIAFHTHHDRLSFGIAKTA